MSTEQLAGARPDLSAGMARARDAIVVFLTDLRTPAGAVAFATCLFILIACAFVLTSKPGIRAFPPPPPTKLQIRNAEAIAKTFSPTPPAQRVPAER